MYAPNGTRRVRRHQIGGDYVSSFSTVGSVPTDISPSSIKNILSVAKLSSTTELSRLTVQQITNLIAGIDTQIAGNSLRISQLTTDIATAENSITALPDGLQAQFDKAEYVLDSTLKEYIRVSTNSLDADQTLSTQRGQLSTLYIRREDLWSSLEGYRKNYSSILSTYRDNKQLLDAETKAYKDLFDEYERKSREYNDAYDKYFRATSTIDTHKATLSTLSSAYIVASSDYDTYLRQFTDYSTITIPDADFKARSTLDEYNRLVKVRDNLLSTIDGASTAMRLAEYQLQVANANQLYSESLAAETTFSNYLLSLTAQYNQATDSAQQSTISTFIGSTNVNYARVHFSTLFYQNNLSSLLSSSLMAMIKDAEQRISSAFRNYQTAQAYENSVISSISGLRLRISSSFPRESQFRSTLSSLSTIYRGHLSTKDFYFSTVSSLTNTEGILSSLLRSTLVNIDTYIKLSTMWGQSTAQYMSTSEYWSTIERNAQSTLDGLIKERDAIISQLGILDGEITGLNGQLATEFGRLDGDATTFFAKKRTELQAEVDEFRYAAREYNSYLGVLTAELLIQKLNLFDQVDLLTFQIQSTIAANDLATKTRLETERTGVTNDQTTLQGLVDRINPLEVTFNGLDGTFQDERLFKTNFINTRSTLHVYERNALSTPTLSTTFRTEYLQAWTDLEGIVTTINTRINTRNTTLDSIGTTISQVKPNLDLMMSKYAGAFTNFPAVATYPYNRASFPIQTRTLPMNTTYALLGAIPYP